MMASPFYLEIQAPDHTIRRIRLDQSEYVIGRSEVTCAIPVSDLKISRTHLRLSKLSDGEWAFADLNSTNGTTIDGIQIRPTQSVAWNKGQTVIIGDTKLVLRTANDFTGDPELTNALGARKIKPLAKYNSLTTPSPSSPVMEAVSESVREIEPGIPNQYSLALDTLVSAPPAEEAATEQKSPTWQGIDDQEITRNDDASDPRGNWIAVDENPTEPHPPTAKDFNRHAQPREFSIVLTVDHQPAKTFVFDKDQIVIGGDKNDCDISLRALNLIGERLIVKRDNSNVFTVTAKRNVKHTNNGTRAQLPYKTAIWPAEQLLQIGNVTLQLKLSNFVTAQWDRPTQVNKWGASISVFLCVLLFVWGAGTGRLSITNAANLFTIGFSVLFLGHGLFTLSWMLYGWNNLSEADRHRSPTTFEKPTFSFTALLPARHEEKVIKDTIRAVNQIDYPDDLKQILVLCRQDDVKTIAKAREVIAELNQPNIELVVFNSYPINKPHSLNIGFRRAANEIITVFDAEDEPHTDLYHVVNTLMVREKVDVVQSGVQLMNYRSRWFSALNVLEYFFWFRSGLHFFTKVGQVTPLGGNSVFFKKTYLEKIGGWDENCLTEDADVGVKLSLIGAKIRIVYDERHATQEETPNSMESFIKQRARWSQGFLQIFMNGDWTRLPQLRQRLVVVYILLTPVIQALLMVTLPIGLWVALNVKLPIGITLISYTPFFILLLQFTIHLYGLYEFTQAYKLKFPLWFPIALMVVYYPYQILLAVGGIRGLYRATAKQNNWEKTAHTNAHRQVQMGDIVSI